MPAWLSCGQVARQRLRSTGVRFIPAGPQGTTRAHPPGLTRREHEVPDLICAGCTNAEIAARLVIAVKAVDHHVSAVLAKPGARRLGPSSPRRPSGWAWSTSPDAQTNETPSRRSLREGVFPNVKAPARG